MDILDKFTSHLKSVLAKSYSLAVEAGSSDINPEHLLLSLLLQKGSLGGELLRKSDVGAEPVRAMLGRLRGLDQPETATHAHALPKLSPDAKRAIEKAVLTANVHEHKYVGTEHLLAGLLDINSPAIEAIMNDQDVDILNLKEKVEDNLRGTSRFPEITETFEAGKAPQKDKAEAKEESKPAKKQKAAAKAAQKTPALDFFAVDMTTPEYQKKVDPVIGRDKEIERLIQILCRRTKNNPALLGEPGVGKTAIVEGLAKKIAQGEVPDVLTGKRIYSLDLGLMLAGTIYRGEFEGRIKQIVDEVKADPDIILFIDELHNIMGAGATSGSIDAANLLKPALARGELHCIGATTLNEYKKHIENDSALERRFQSIIVDPPTPEHAVIILKGVRSNYEQYHGVEISDEAIEAAVQLSERYMTDRFLPDKAVDLIDEAAACVRVAHSAEAGARKIALAEEELEKINKKKQKAVSGENFIEALDLKAREKQLEHEIVRLRREAASKDKPKVGRIGRADVAAVIARATGIPASELLATEKDRLLKMEKILGGRLIGQDEAVAAVSETVRRAKTGIGHPGRPLASFLFVGPSGVGKTEMAKLLAETAFQDPRALVRIDMSEFSEGFNISKLIGAPAGYVGYKEGNKFTDVIKRKPHSVVLFDEIEKAHPDVHNLLLQILEDGHITDATGRKVDFKHTIIVMTSNVGAQQMSAGSIGFSSAADGEVNEELAEEIKSRAQKELESAFRPEFLNRIDKVIAFRPLGKSDLEQIVRLQIADLDGRISRDYGVHVSVQAPAVAIIAEKAWNPLFGARGVRRQIQELVENPLAKRLLEDDCVSGDSFVLGAKSGALALVKKQTHARAAAAN